MIGVVLGIITRIFSNSYLNVCQKKLTDSGSKPSVVNFFTYLGLSFICILLYPAIKIDFSAELFVNFFIMGILGALGNYYIIKALSRGELSSIAPINSYKPVVAMIISFLYLGEVPSFGAISGFILIIAGTYILHGYYKNNKIAVLYRALALIFSGTEAVFIKKIILLTNIPTSFALWVISGLIFSAIFVLCSKHKLKISHHKYQILLILAVAAMQYSTNYVFSKINVAYALALFQLSTVLSVFLGVNVFKEKGLWRKIIASIIMISGAVVIILA